MPHLNSIGIEWSIAKLPITRNHAAMLSEQQLAMAAD
jgi:hypothetical protein